MKVRRSTGFNGAIGGDTENSIGWLGLLVGAVELLGRGVVHSFPPPAIAAPIASLLWSRLGKVRDSSVKVGPGPLKQPRSMPGLLEML